MQSDDTVVIEKGKKPGEPHIVTVNCPDKTGLACDVCRIVLDFGLYITKGDVSTDGNWCYIVLWVVPNSGLVRRWTSLKNRLLSACPSCSISFVLPNYLLMHSNSSSPVYLLTFFSLDRKGLLHGSILMELLHTKKRQDETCEQLQAVLGESCISCELQLAGTEYECLQGRTSLCPAIADELFQFEITDRELRSQALSPDLIRLKSAGVRVDNSLSPVHTLLQIHCLDHKGLLYDVMRTLKDCNIQVSYGRFSPNTKGHRELDLFIQQKDGNKKIVDPDKQKELCSRLKVEMLHPLRVMITNRGPDPELLVANPVELSGNRRPMVFYEVTLALKALEICIFSAEIGRHSAGEREWEVYRFLLDEKCRYQLWCESARNEIVDRVRRTLMGW
ncbi:ACT domain-containing protein ACR9 [Linum grandiflorum]